MIQIGSRDVVLFDERLVLVTQIMRDLNQSGDLFPSDCFLISEFKAPSQSTDWQTPTSAMGGVFVATRGRLISKMHRSVVWRAI